MLVVRNVFRCKPGQAKVLVGKFKAAIDALGSAERQRILTDVAAGFWTVVLETEVDDLGAWETVSKSFGDSTEVQNAMQGYMDLVDGGHREIFRIE